MSCQLSSAQLSGRAKGIVCPFAKHGLAIRCTVEFIVYIHSNIIRIRPDRGIRGTAKEWRSSPGLDGAVTRGEWCM